MTEFNVPKGHRDFFGQEARLRNHIRSTLTRVFESYGYQPLETPLVEDLSTVTFKGGDEIQKEVYTLTDNGGRDLALRFDQTVPLARFVASNRDQLSLPLKRYAIGTVFRDGPTQPEQGRFRSFGQNDVDVLGIPGMTAEAELLALAQDAFGALGLGGIDIRLNNRKLLDGILAASGVPDHANTRTIAILDNLDKIGVEGVEERLTQLTYRKDPVHISEGLMRKLREGDVMANVAQHQDALIEELTDFGYQELSTVLATAPAEELASALAQFGSYGPRILEKRSVDSLLEMVGRKGSNQKLLTSIGKQIEDTPSGAHGVGEVQELLGYTNDMGIDAIRFTPSLARGLNYYTGTTLEVFLQDASIVNSAILAGGRFDNMVGDYCGGTEQIPAVGFSFGLERLAMILESKGEHGITSSPTQIYLIPFGNAGQALGVAHQLRQDGLNVDMVHGRGPKMKKLIPSLEKQGTPFIGFYGDTEAAEGVIGVKNLATGHQENVRVEDVANYIASQQ